MIYLFGTEDRDGYYAVRYIAPVTKEFGYIYREIENETLE